MIASKITTRYAKSLLDLAIETNQLKECYNDLLAVEALCSKSNDFSLMLKSPIINTSKKLSILKSLFENKLSKTHLAKLNVRRASSSSEIAAN